MPLTPAQIKDKLTSALDDDKNVVDEEAVEEVITLLETCALTKEILEQTRLGRDINLVRKTSRNPATAKRARNLVKAWKKLFVVPGSPQVVNGQHPGTLSATQFQRVSPGLQRVSPGLSPALSRASTPVKCLPSPALSLTRQQKVSASRSPTVQSSKLSQQPQSVSKLAQLPRATGGTKSPLPGSQHAPAIRNTSINANGDSNLSWPGTPPSNVSESSQDRLTGDRDSSKQNSSSAGGARSSHSGTNKRNFNFDHKPSDHSVESTSKSVNRASDQRDVSKKNVANRKRTRGNETIPDNSNDSFSEPPSSKQPRLISSSPSLSTPAFSKNDVINGSVVRKSGLKSPGISSAVDSSVIDSKAIDSLSSKGIFQELPEISSPLSRTSQRLAMTTRQDNVSCRLSMQSSDSKLSRDKVGKVKTTEQLIEDMQRKSTSPVGSKVIVQIRTNQILKESDSQKTVLPPGIKRRGRKKKQNREQLELPDTESGSDGRKLARTKSEYIERFLQTSVAPTPGEDIYEAPISHSRQESLEEPPIALGGCSSTFTQSAYESGFSSYTSRQDKPDSGPSASPPEAREILDGSSHHLPSSSCGFTDVNTTASERLTAEQIAAQLPPIDANNIDWTSHDYPSVQPVQVTNSQVEQLHCENVEGVNGTYDRDGQFRSWAEMLTMDCVYDEPLHILPYVMLDE